MLQRIIYILLFLFVLSGCVEITKNNENNGATMVGYVVKKNESRVLFVSEHVNPNNNYETIWTSGIKNIDIRVGQEIEVKFKGPIQTSNPGQGIAESVKIIPMESHGKTQITPDVALGNALKLVENWEVPIVKQISYDDENKKWMIVIFDSKNIPIEEKTILIDDK